MSQPTRSREPRRGGFWLVAGSLLAASVVLVIAIWANRDVKDNIGHAQASLRAAQALAEQAFFETGSLAGAGAAALSDPAETLTFRGPDDASTGLDDLSVSASESVWAAAVQAAPGACFYLRIDAAGGPSLEISYGTGEVCTGREALTAYDARW